MRWLRWPRSLPLLKSRRPAAPLASPLAPHQPCPLSVVAAMGSCFSSESQSAGRPGAQQAAHSAGQAPPPRQPHQHTAAKPSSELHTKRRTRVASRQREEFDLEGGGLIAARPPSSTHSRHSRRASDADGNTQLHLAAAAGDAAAVAALLGRRALLAATNIEGW